MNIETRLQAHLDEVATAAIPLADRPLRQHDAPAALVQFAGHNGGHRVGRSLVAGLCGLALTLAAVLVVQQRERGHSPFGVQTSIIDDRPGFIITDLPAGFGTGSRPKLVDPQNLAPEPASLEVQYRETNGKGRVSLVPILLNLGPVAAADAAEPGIDVAGVRRLLRSNGSAKVVVIPVAGVPVSIFSSDVTDATLTQIANAVVRDTGRFVIPVASLPAGWDGPRSTASDAVLAMQTVRYRRGTSWVSAASPPAGEWPVGNDGPLETTPAGTTIRFKTVPATETQFTEGYVDIDGTTVQLRGVRVSRTEMVVIAGHLRRATAQEWNALDRQPAHAVGSEIVAGTIVKEGRVGASRFRIVRTDASLSHLGHDGFVNGLIGAVGASAFAPVSPSDTQPASAWGNGVIMIAQPAKDLPNRAHLALSGSAPVDARFLPAVAGQEVRMVFIPGKLEGRTGTLTITGGDPSHPVTLHRWTVANGNPMFCELNCPTPQARPAQSTASSRLASLQSP